MPFYSVGCSFRIESENARMEITFCERKIERRRELTKSFLPIKTHEKLENVFRDAFYFRSMPLPEFGFVSVFSAVALYFEV